jgi:hypothetical protein
MLISTALLLDSIIRNSVCTPAKLPCRRVEVGYEMIMKLLVPLDYFYILLIRINKDITPIRYVKKINELTNKFKFINYVCTTVKKHTKSKNFLKNKTAIFF